MFSLFFTSRTLLGRIRVLTVFLLFLLSASKAFAAGQDVLAWDANPDPRVTGYMVYYGQTSGSYTSKIDVGNKTSYTVTSLLEGQAYYYVVTAYDAARTESGSSNEISRTVPYSPPAANFTSNVTSGVAPLAVTFTNSSSGTITGYSWNFGDGTGSTAASPSHSYAAAGIYSVSLTVTGPGGSNTQTKASLITVSASTPTLPPPSSAPTASFTTSATSGTVPVTVNFTSTSTGSISAYAWTFGDGTTSTAQNPSHTYNAPGTFTATLKVSNATGSTTSSKTITVSSSPTTNRQGLVAAYSFNEGTGSVVSDKSGKGNTGSISGASWTTGRYGKALSFNGSNSLVSVNDSASLDLSSGMTIEAWIYPTTTMNGWRAVVMKEQTGNATYYLYANADGNQPATAIYSGGEHILYGSTQIAVNAWTHLTATYDGATQRLYVNGVQVASRAQTGAIQVSGNKLYVGGNTVWGEYFQGVIDEVRIYNRALSVSEIQGDMAAAITP